MKKTMILILTILILTLSGCSNDDKYVDGATNLQYDETHDTWFMCIRTDNGTNLDCDIVYTQAQVDEIIKELETE